LADPTYTVALRLVTQDGKGGSEDENVNITKPNLADAVDRGIAWLEAKKGAKKSGK